jgi:hypothetical protein
VCRALLRGLDRDPAETPRCPACNEGLAEPTDEQLLSVADWSRPDLLEAYGALGVCTFGPPPVPARGRARLMWCAACDRLFPAGKFPAEHMRLMYEGVRPEAAPYGLLRCLRDEDLLRIVLVSTGHSETEERWLKARGGRSWLNYYDYVPKAFDNYWHVEALVVPVLTLALHFGYWPEDTEPPAGTGPPAAGSPYGDILVDGGPPPFEQE